MPVWQWASGPCSKAHPDPDRAKCDGPSALPLDKLEAFLQQIKAIDELVKSSGALEIN